MIELSASTALNHGAAADALNQQATSEKALC
jgi:hypothetical protein